MLYQSITYSLFLALLLALSSCGGGSDKNVSVQQKARGTLVADTHVDSAQSNNLFLKYAVKAYKISYISLDTKGNKVTLSGLLAVPQKDPNKKSPLLSYQHGTRFKNENRPSNNTEGLMQLAAQGYIVSAPDYLGYGDSLTKGHPYIHASSYANAAIDMLRASKAFLSREKTPVNKQLFLAGYSEGGYATLALQQAIQKSYVGEFKVTASAAGAGPYHISATATFMFKKEKNNKPAFMNFVIQSYDDTYQLKQVATMYQPQYVNAINTVFDGLHSSGQINKSLTTETSKLFIPAFLATMRAGQGSKAHPLKEKLAENDIYDWKPVAPTLLFHSKYDEIVPYFNSEDAYEAMQNKGTQNISFKKCGLNRLGTHVACAAIYLRQAKFFFEDYNPEL
jgi:pimeloyl-ACP methyl ester carboxylesterase